MIVTAHDGNRWATVAEAATLTRVRADLIRKWKHRGKIRAATVTGILWVCLDDVQDQELALRRRGGGPGRPRVGSAGAA